MVEESQVSSGSHGYRHYDVCALCKYSIWVDVGMGLSKVQLECTNPNQVETTTSEFAGCYLFARIGTTDEELKKRYWE